MPTYEYGCEACGNSWEVVQRITDAKLTDCPACGQPKARRLISGGNFVLKGGGWYADGYGNTKPSSSSTSSSSETSSSKADSGTKSDSSTKSDSAPKSESTASKSSDSGSKSSD